MRKPALVIIALLLTVFLLAACGQDNNNDAAGTAEAVVVPTDVPTATPTPTLPATYTPAPGGHGGHLYAVETRAIHIVQPGETLGGIASMYGTTVNDLAQTNRIYNYNLIEVGDVLYVPPCD